MLKEDTMSYLRVYGIKFSCWQPVKFLTELFENEMFEIKRLPHLRSANLVKR